jgi:hypothetical protein
MTWGGACLCVAFLFFAASTTHLAERLSAGLSEALPGHDRTNSHLQSDRRHDTRGDRTTQRTIEQSRPLFSKMEHLP